MRIGKKAQTPVPGVGVPIAVLILLIALFLVIYILLLPPAEKEKLLGMEEEEEAEEGEEVEVDVVSTLVSETPGLVYPIEEREEKHKIDSVSLFSTVETETTTLANTLRVSRSIFQNKKQTLTFKIKDLDNLEKASILFFIRESRGNLIIKLNGIEVYNGKVSSRDLPIELPLIYLKEENVVELSCNFPGWKFLSTNLYDLRDVQLVEKYRVEEKKASRTFVLGSAEKDNLEKATLEYFVNCITVRERGTLKISLNHKLISVYVVVCDAGERKLEINKDEIVAGRNLLEFEIDKGNYIIEQLQVVTETERKYYPRYEFYIEEDEFHDIEEDTLNAMLYLDFISEGKKAATILVNGKRINLDTDKDSYSKEISAKVVEGKNYIKLIPKTEFEILSLEIKLEE